MASIKLAPLHSERPGRREAAGGHTDWGEVTHIAETMRAETISPRTKNRRATHCVQREYSWLLAALAQSRLAHSCLPRRSIITRCRRTTAMITHHRTTATVTDGLGMTARPVGPCRVETVHPTKVRLAEDCVLRTAVRPITQSKGETANRIEDISSHCGRS